jgi:general stress protein 26
MKVLKQRNEEMQEIADHAASISTSMFCAADFNTFELNSRPMMPVEMDEHGALWYLTKSDFPEQVTLDSVVVSFADSAKSKYVSFSGAGRVVYDRVRIAALWSPMAKPWFPEGVDDPTLVALRIDVSRAEIWDGPSSRVVRLLAMAASVVAGEPIGLGSHKEVPNTANVS